MMQRFHRLARIVVALSALMPAVSRAELPVARPGEGFGFAEIARRHGDFALAGVACAVTDGRAGIALFGVGSTPVRARAAEAALIAGAAPGEVADAAVADLDPPADVHASASTRTRIARHLVERAVTRAQEVVRAAG